MTVPKLPGNAPVLLTVGQARDSYVNKAKTSIERWARSGPLNKYFKFHGLNDDDLIPDIAEEIFLKRHDEYLSSIPVPPGKKRSSTRDNHSSQLKQWWYGDFSPRITPKQHGHGDGLLEGFRDALEQAVSESGMTLAELVAATGDTKGSIKLYLAGLYQPTEKSRWLIERIEHVLKLAPGALTRRCWRLSGADSHVTENFQARRKHVTARMKARYWYKFRSWTPRLRKEWEHLSDVAKGQLIPFPGFKCSNFWSPNGDDDGTVTCETTVAKPFEAFFGFCIRVGYPPEYLTIALVKNYPLVAKFFEYLRVRNGGTFLTDPSEMLGDLSAYPGFHTTTSETWSRVMAALLRPERGYLWQIASYANALATPAPAESYLPTPAIVNVAPCSLIAPQSAQARQVSKVSDEEVQWRAECEEAWASHAGWLVGLTRRSQLRRVRSGAERVDWITERDDPLTPIVEGANKMERLLPPEPNEAALGTELYLWRKAKRALAYQDMLMLRLLMAIPLRPKNLRLMTFTGTNPNLFKKKGSERWWLTYKKWQMKNKKEPAICLPASLTPYIDEFLANHRPFMLGANTKYVFRHALRRNGSTTARPHAAIGDQALRDRFLLFTSVYIGKPGFSPNLMRHIVVTAWLKEDPNGLMVAAAVLDDEVGQILKSYSQIRKQDLYGYYDRFHEATVQRVTHGVVPHDDMRGLSRHALEIFATALGNAKHRQQSVADVEGAVKAILRSVISKEALRKPAVCS